MNKKKILLELQIKKEMEQVTDNTLLKLLKEKNIDPDRIWTSNDRRKLQMYLSLNLSIEKIAINMNRGYFFIKDKIQKDLKYSYNTINDFKILLKNKKINIK